MAGALRTWQQHGGSTSEERSRSYPAAALVPGTLLFRAVDVHAPAETTFRWLCQLRVAPYSYDLLDNFGRRSPRQLTPGLENLAVGQRAVAIFDIAAFEPGRSLTLGLRRASSIFGPIAITYDVQPTGPDSCRLVAALSMARPNVALEWGDLFMMRKQLRTLAKLAERSHASSSRQ